MNYLTSVIRPDALISLLDSAFDDFIDEQPSGVSIMNLCALLSESSPRGDFFRQMFQIALDMGIAEEWIAGFTNNPKKRMLEIIDEQLAKKKGAYILAGFTASQLDSVRRFIKSFRD